MTTQETVSAPGGVVLDGDLELPNSPRAVVLFVHGSGSSRRSPRNRAVALALRHSGLASLLPDLLTPQEAEEDAVSRKHRFDIPLLAERVVAAVDWLGEHPATRELPLHLFGASTGAAAALVAAERRPARVRSVVSRGGRPDLAEESLEQVRAPVLLLVGELDTDVLRLNREAAARLQAPCEVEIVPGASHLFEEPGTLERVTESARDWFLHPPAPAGNHGSGGDVR
ncbi:MULTISPECIES: dienelactone hydrolase family protein [Streptomyces]|uniref:Alpha/beta fold hydrolase n=2 Tax=Streptomyces rimosus subsp. rimosus TaxID=132474 RepID=L8ESH9_STRR1|nr:MULTISPECIES: alpha/beta fold hydrolase [Streptomyces]KOG78225.1 DeoR faimly transcriptional regulator [Kitasatospora aureofaciens]MYT46772.1 alpha/beta fold hydrolase [Streptomyces sp. SID5471]KUJ29211.1 hydrolase [Streptomyces rimosus subsp. rimosus]QDA02754.1 alpha/beta hydrolase [Streptomyces rimosus]QEV74024.1 alpha/beta fold hydrolase [Streptomyces rimosus]